MVRLHIQPGVNPDYEQLRRLVRSLKGDVRICVRAGEQKAIEIVRRVIEGERATIQFGA